MKTVISLFHATHVKSKQFTNGKMTAPSPQNNDIIGELANCYFFSLKSMMNVLKL